ncbi:MAG: 3-methyl-2-oxobutanoate hydroxymethyltransferase [Desulfobacteraceae bacterium]|nr:MAG: 3-methyl-2-oxobutanoate hydroxymethyltransferase [Desulfobacteraceae bacterium]
MKKDLEYLKRRKLTGEKITMLTCYDYPTAVLEEEAGVDIIFVGDSVGTNILGYGSEQEVLMDDMVHHLKAVRRGVTTAYLLVDMPYGSCDTPGQALENARRFLANGADGVKIEGIKADVVKHLSTHGVEVCSHLGLTPQTEKPGYKAKAASEAYTFVQEVFLMEAAGAKIILFETIPDEISEYLTSKLSVPTIGIGAGKHTDGQVLVVLDMLGWSSFNFRHNKKYENFRERALSAIRSYVDEVNNRKFPGEENLRHMNPVELEGFLDLIKNRGRS